ncbi:MAG: DegV family protein [Chloroflexi bacterium]|nr:DegV family protein [Chloroflexota bacterium]
MRNRVCIVTDSTAHFSDPTFPQRHSVTVVPLAIHLGEETYLDGVNISTEQLFARVARGAPLPTASSPGLEQLLEIYQNLSRTGAEVVSIHVSSKLSQTWQNARAASKRLLGRSTVVPIDSATTSVGLGLLVEAAARAAQAGESLEEIVRIVRGMIPRLYIVFFTESLDYLEKSGRIGKAQAVLGAMLGIKPFLILEEGDILPMEKVRTRQQAIEKLLEFVCEFSNLKYLAILQQYTRPNQETNLLLERLALDFPGGNFEVIPYSPSLATFVGPNSMGVAVFEGEGDAD